MFATDFIFKQQDNLFDNQKCQAGFRLDSGHYVKKISLGLDN